MHASFVVAANAPLYKGPFWGRWPSFEVRKAVGRHIPLPSRVDFNTCVFHIIEQLRIVRPSGRLSDAYQLTTTAGERQPVSRIRFLSPERARSAITRQRRRPAAHTYGSLLLSTSWASDALPMTARMRAS